MAQIGDNTTLLINVKWIFKNTNNYIIDYKVLGIIQSVLM